VNNKLSFAIKNAELLSEEKESSFSILSLDFFASGKNLNDSYVSEETLNRTADTIKNCPVVWKYSSMFDDAGTHDKEEIACGFVPQHVEIQRKKLEDGRTMLTVISYVWKKFSGEILNFFKRDGDKPISVELTLYEAKDRDDGLKELLDYKFEAVTILGSLITPAIPLAHATVMQFQKEYSDAYIKEFSLKYENIDMSIPENVKKNVDKGLALYKEYNRGASATSLASARFVAKSNNTTPEKVRHIAKIHKSNKFNNMIKSPPSDTWISYMLYGGKDGMEWATDISNKLDEQDKQQLSYFSEEEIVTFPYKNIGDINPALKGIDPPISLSQANAIATQADAIGGDYGWPTAINSFKKTHIVKDGKWVKKEKNMEDEKDLKKPEEDMAEAPPEKKEEEMAAEEKETKEEKEEPKTEEMASKIEDKKETKEEEKKEQEKEGEDKKETPEEEKKEEEKETKDKEDKEEKMSLDENLDVKAILAMLDNETEAYKKISSDFESGKMDMKEFVSQIYCKMCKMAEDNKAFADENVKLKSFKSDVENQKFDFEVKATMKDIEEHSDMPKEKKDFLLEESKKFSLETIDAWKNLAKSEAFSFAIKGKEEDTELRFANPWGTKDTSKKSSLWD